MAFELVPKPFSRSEQPSFGEAVTWGILNGNGDHALLNAAHMTVKDPGTFDSIFMGTLAAATPEAIWAEAIKRALESYYTYRPEERGATDATR